ncbi:hypothetical protein NDU88_001886 [Pleurodeles waltl]|uniref:Uncharacterized protein n=1 Tax=Pleurodeles waltl TaxID=8319 RepID=A0AAV7UXD2_PLEWA|nr:hypothetical protein NDU88_001886 [Pleurodeles waltl]
MDGRPGPRSEAVRQDGGARRMQDASLRRGLRSGCPFRCLVAEDCWWIRAAGWILYSGCRGLAGRPRMVGQVRSQKTRSRRRPGDERRHPCCIGLTPQRDRGARGRPPVLCPARAGWAWARGLTADFVLGTRTEVWARHPGGGSWRAVAPLEPGEGGTPRCSWGTITELPTVPGDGALISRPCGDKDEEAGPVPWRPDLETQS